MNVQRFTTKDAWLGGFYELALEVGPRSDTSLRTVLECLWKHPDLDGCYLDRHLEPYDQVKVTPSLLQSGSHLLGIARLPNGIRVACGSSLIRESYDGHDGPDWVNLYLPMGSLATAYPVGGYPFGDEDFSDCRFEVEDWLAGLGLVVSQTVSFRLGLIGFEVSGNMYAADIEKQGIPTKRDIGILWPSGSSMRYYRRT